MTNENSRNNRGKILLTDVPMKLREARNVAPNVDYKLHDFCDYLADISSNQIFPMGMILLLSSALNDLQKERCESAFNVRFPENLKTEKHKIIIYLSYFPLIIDKIASKEFAEEFRNLFAKFFCNPQPPEDDSIEDFSVNIIEEEVDDTFKKHRSTVASELFYSFCTTPPKHFY